MFFTCNTTITVLGPYTNIDEWGDEIDADVIIMMHIPASLTEQTTKSQGEISTTPFVSRKAVIRIPESYMSYISQNCRLKDENNNDVWLIDDIRYMNNALGHQSPRINVSKAS